MFRTSPVHHQERFLQAVFADLVCAVIRVLLDTSSRYKVVGRTIYYKMIHRPYNVRALYYFMCQGNTFWGFLRQLRIILGFCSKVAENCALMDYYAASSGNFLPTFRDNVWVPSSEFLLYSWNLMMGPEGFPETSVWNYPYLLRNDPEARSSQL